MRDLGTVEKITDASLQFTLRDNTTFTLDGDNIALSGLSFDTATSVDGQFTIGGAVTGQLSVTLMNADDSLSSYDFRDAHIVAFLVGLDEDDVSTSIQVGLYTVNEFTYNGSNISLVAYDYMSKFDFPCTDLGNLASLTFPLTLTEMVQDACTACGVTLVSPSNPIPNGTYSITKQPEQWNTMTWHDVISACAQLGGCYAKVDKYGRLYFDWYTVPSSTNTYDGGTFNTTTTPYSDGDPLDGGTFSYTDGATADGGTFGDRANYHVIPAPYALTVDTDDVYITGLQVSLAVTDNIYANENTTDYMTPLSGTEGYVITISGNPFIETTANAVTIRDYLAGVVVGMLFRPMQATIVEDPTIEAGDTAIVTGRGNEQYQCFISHVAYTVSAATTIACDAESTSLSSKTRFTQSDKANTTITQIKKDLSSVTRVAGNTNQYFWHTETGTDTGAHITEIPQDEFLDDPENGGGNLLARSNGIAVRDGLTELSTFSANGITIGISSDSNVLINTDGISFNNDSSTVMSQFAVSGLSINNVFSYPILEVGRDIPSTWYTISECVEYDNSSPFYVDMHWPLLAMTTGSTSATIGAIGLDENYAVILDSEGNTVNFAAQWYASNGHRFVFLESECEDMISHNVKYIKYSYNIKTYIPYFTFGSAGPGEKGLFSVREGENCSAIGKAAHSEGESTIASEDAAHAEGLNSVASGKYSHAEGWATTASGNYGSHAEGWGTQAKNWAAHAQNSYTIAASTNQTAIGKYNIEDSSGTYALIIGNGSSTQRSNALTVDWSGNVTAAGQVYSNYTTWSSTNFSNASGEVFAVKMGHIVWVHGYHSLNNGVGWTTTIMTLPWGPIQAVSVSTQNDASGAYYSGYFDVQTDGRITVGTSWSGYTRYSFVYMTSS